MNKNKKINKHILDIWDFLLDYFIPSFNLLKKRVERLEEKNERDGK